MEFQPPSSNAAIQSMSIFIGEWETEVSSIRMDPSARYRGQASFQWLEGGAFVVQRAQVPNSAFPVSTAILGPDDSAGTYCMLYFDSRGVSRIYQMSLGAGDWKLWRDFPGFSQRFTARINDDQNILTGYWEASTNGSDWEHDFDIKYMKLAK